MKRYSFVRLAAVLTVTLLTGAFALGLLPPGHDGWTIRAGAPVAVARVDKKPHHDLAELRLFNSVVLLVNDRYFDPDRVRPREMLLSALDHVEKRIAEVLVDESRALDRGEVTVTVGQASRTFDISRVESLWEMSFRLKDTFAFIQKNLVSTQDTREIEYAAINGMLATLDPHSNLLDPTQYTDMQMHTRGEFGGLGFVVSMRDGKLTVMKVLKKTPAHRGGIKARDVITRIEDESTVNMDLTEAVKQLRGKPGTKVVFYISRKGFEQPRKFVVVRAQISIDSIDPVRLLDGAIGYVRITNFQGNTTRDLRRAMLDLAEQSGGPLKGLVLDLRSNPGGLLDQAIQVADLFVREGTIVSTVGMSNKLRERKFATPAGTMTEIPLVVLVNNGSASASEIVSGALKNLNRGIVIGSQTFGKGSVQVLYPQHDDSALKLTIAEYLTPGDISIQEVGVTPDIELVPALANKSRIMFFAPRPSMREADLEEHMIRDLRGAIPGASKRRFGTQQEKNHDTASHHLTFLRDDVPEGEEIDEFEEPEWKEDFHVRFARELLGATSASNRKQMLAEAKGVIDARQQSERKRIEKKLAGLGVDWSAGAGGPQPSLSVKLSVGQKAVAGDEISVVITVTNDGPTTAYRVRAWTRTRSPRHVHYWRLFDRLEFVFGKIEPGQTRRWTVPVKLPDDLPARLELLEVHLEADGYSAPAPAISTVSLGELARPVFRFAWELDDAEHGNADGMFSEGEEATLRVSISNFGQGTARETIATIKNLSSEKVYISRGRHHLGEIVPGATAVAQLTLDLKAGFDESVARVLVTVYDRKLAEFISDEIEIPVVRSGTDGEAISGSLQIGSAVDVVAWADRAATVLARAAKGARLPVTHRFDDLLRVEFSPGRFGFVPASAGKLTRRTRKRPTGTITLTYPHQAPTIELVGNPVAPSVDTPDFNLSGVAVDASGLRDVYVFLNNQKVYFKAFRGEGSPKISFATKVRLDEGLNTLVLFARENDELVSRRTVVLYRAPATIAVAPESK